MFWVKFFENFFCPVFRGGSSLQKISKKIRKVSKFQKCPKLLQKVSKRVLNMFWGKLFEKFWPIFHGGSRLRKISNKIRKVSKFQKCPKLLPKVSKRVLNMFWGKFFEKVHAQCSMECRVFEHFRKKSKKFQIS